MTTVNQGMNVEEIKQVVAQRVDNAIEAIAIYETKTNLAHKSMSQTERQEEKVAENANNKRKWGSNHNRSLSQQNKGHKVPRAHTAWPINKKAYAGSLPLCNQCKFHHNETYPVKCGNCKKKSETLQSRTRGKTLAELTLQGMWRRNITADQSHCVLNATITMMVHVLPNATSATELA
nr:hypothetical protein [Tanacetum cinerariifolium]